MRKVLSCLIILALLLSVSVSSYAAMFEDNVLFSLAGYGIVDVDNQDENITRGEFADIVVKLLGLDETAKGQLAQTSYIDVASDYEYAADIELLTQIGLLNGVSADRFEPKSHLKYEQAIKVMIHAIGYGDIAERCGGWFEGYRSVALQNNMLGGVSLKNPFSRDDLYRLIYNTLDVQVLSEVFTTAPEETLVKSGDTLGDVVARTAGDRLFKHRGIITANSFTYTSSPYPDLEDDEVVIYNTTVGNSFFYKIGKTDADSLIGCSVEFYARETDGVYELLSVRPAVDNEIVSVSSHNLGSKSGNTFSYTNEHGKGERLTLDTSQLKVVYNGTRVVSPADSIYDINDGYITFINNDADAAFDLVMIWAYENAIATSFDGERFTFSNDTKFDSQLSLFVDKDDKAVKMLVTDKEGNRVESFQDERTVSIFKDLDRTRYTVRVSDIKTEGVIDSISEEYLYINGTEYPRADSLGSGVLLGKTYSIYINFEDKISYTKESDAKNYAYILAYDSEGINRKVSAKLILPGTVDAGVEKNEEDITDTSSVPYLILQNSGICVLDFADKVKCESGRYSGSTLLDLLSRSDMKVVSYTLNENGEIKEITPLVKKGGNVTELYKYSVWDRVFGGTEVEAESGFALNSETKVVCVPVDSENNIRINASDEDFMMKTNITEANNKFGYRVEGYDYNEETKKVRLLVVHSDMNAGYMGNLDVFATRASIVTGTRFVRNSDTGEMEQEVSVISGTELKTLKPNTLSPANSAIERLKKGDLICYLTNNNDLLQNVSVIEAIPELRDEFEHSDISSSREKIFGTVTDISYDEVDTDNYRLYTKLMVSVNGSSPRTFKIPATNTPPIYVYIGDEDTFQNVSLKDVRPGSDKVYIFKQSGSSLVRAIVLVR